MDGSAEPKRRIRAADDVDVIYDGIQKLKRDRAAVLSAPPELPAEMNPGIFGLSCWAIWRKNHGATDV